MSVIPKATSGVVNLHKPPGVTSRRAIDYVKRLLKPAKVGHAGTLDPLASGVLVVCVGAATRLIAYVQAMPKRYIGTFLLGRESDTEDTEGEVRLTPGPEPGEAELRAAAARFVGHIQQRPPAYSALKVAGRRAYDLARAGRSFELAPRPVVIHRMEVLRYDFPELVLDVECGSGTYIRSLGRDLAEAVGTSAVMSGLVRTEVGCFHLEDARSPDALTADTMADWLHPPTHALKQLATVTLAGWEVDRVRHGMPIRDPRNFEGGTMEGQELAAVDERNQLVAILLSQCDGTLRPVRNFATR